MQGAKWGAQAGGLREQETEPLPFLTPPSARSCHEWSAARAARELSMVGGGLPAHLISGLYSKCRGSELGCGARGPAFKSWSCHFPAVWLWVSHLTSLCLSILTYGMRVKTVPRKHGWLTESKTWCIQSTWNSKYITNAAGITFRA